MFKTCKNYKQMIYTLKKIQLLIQQLISDTHCTLTISYESNPTARQRVATRPPDTATTTLYFLPKMWPISKHEFTTLSPQYSPPISVSLTIGKWAISRIFAARQPARPKFVTHSLHFWTSYFWTAREYRRLSWLSFWQARSRKGKSSRVLFVNR